MRTNLLGMVIVAALSAPGAYSEPTWGLKGTTVLSCIYGENTSVPNEPCRIISGPAVSPDNAAVTGVYLIVPPTAFNLDSYEVDLAHQGATTPLVAASIASQPIYPTESAPNTALNGLLVEGGQGLWIGRVSGAPTNGNLGWAVHYTYAISWEVKPRFRTQFTGKPAVLRIGTASHIFSRTTDGRLVDVYRPTDGDQWIMYDRSAAAASVFVASDPAVQILGSVTYVYARTWENRLFQWSSISGERRRAEGRNVSFTASCGASHSYLFRPELLSAAQLG